LKQHMCVYIEDLKKIKHLRRLADLRYEIRMKNQSTAKSCDTDENVSNKREVTSEEFR
jgi:hypothetical protein